MNKGKLLIMGLLSLVLAFGMVLASCDNGVLSDEAKYDTDKENAETALGKVGGAQPSGGGGNSANDIVGSWTGVGGLPVTITLDSDGSGTFSMSGMGQPTPITYKFASKKLTVSMQDSELFTATVNLDTTKEQITLSNINSSNPTMGEMLDGATFYKQGGSGPDPEPWNG